MRYDYFTRLEDVSEIKKHAGFFREMGWDGIVVGVPYNRTEEARRKAGKIKDIDVVIGAEINVKSPQEAKKIAKRVRPKAEIVIGIGGTGEMNRAIVETPEFDVLSGHIQENRTLGINHVLSRLAKKNDVSICLEFNPVLMSSGKTRAMIMSAMIESCRMISKYGSPFVVCSGAFSKWDMRSPHELVVFGKMLGLDEADVKRSMSDVLVKRNRKRLEGKIVMKGVEIERE